MVPALAEGLTEWVCEFTLAQFTPTFAIQRLQIKQSIYDICVISEMRGCKIL